MRTSREFEKCFKKEYNGGSHRPQKGPHAGSKKV
jgi:hypothetical protein